MKLNCFQNFLLNLDMNIVTIRYQVSNISTYLNICILKKLVLDLSFINYWRKSDRTTWDLPFLAQHSVQEDCDFFPLKLYILVSDHPVLPTSFGMTGLYPHTSLPYLQFLLKCPLRPWVDELLQPFAVRCLA